MSSGEISNKLAETQEYIQAIAFLLESQPEFSNDILERLLEGVTKSYEWKKYDNFSMVAYLVLKSTVAFSYDAKVNAARLLSHTAYNVNRFGAQNLIEELKKRGIEPSIEEILD